MGTAKQRRRVLSSASSWLLDSENCSPFTEDYNTVSVFGTTDTQIQIECEQRNAGNLCAIRSCMVETLFVQKIFQELFLGGVFDASLKHSLGQFDTKVCRTNAG